MGYGIPNNPIKDIELPKSSKPRTRRLLDDEFSILMKNAIAQRNKYIADIIEFAVGNWYAPIGNIKFKVGEVQRVLSKDCLSLWVKGPFV